jgi:hypothetical protein
VSSPRMTPEDHAPTDLAIPYVGFFSTLLSGRFSVGVEWIEPSVPPCEDDRGVDSPLGN